MRWAGYVAHRGIEDVRTVFWWGKLWEREHLQDLGIDRRIILKLIFKKWYGEAWTGLISCEPPGSIKCGRRGGGIS
jgi:hypothetical protein